MIFCTTASPGPSLSPSRKKTPDSVGNTFAGIPGSYRNADPLERRLFAVKNVLREDTPPSARRSSHASAAFPRQIQKRLVSEDPSSPAAFRTPLQSNLYLREGPSHLRNHRSTKVSAATLSSGIPARALLQKSVNHVRGCSACAPGCARVIQKPSVSEDSERIICA